MVDTTRMATANHGTVSPHHLKPRRWNWRGYTKFALAWVLVISVGRFVVPTSSNASPTAGVDGPGLGTIVGPGYRVRISAGSPDPMYTVLSADGTTTLGRGLTAAELSRRFPSLNPTTLNATPIDASVDVQSRAVGHE